MCGIAGELSIEREFIRGCEEITYIRRAVYRGESTLRCGLGAKLLRMKRIECRVKNDLCPACLDFGLHADRRILYSTARYRSMAIQVSAETFREMPCRVRGAHTAFYEASICPGEGAEQIQACSLPRFQSTPRRIAFPIGLAPVIWRVIRFVRHLPGRLRS